MKKERDFQAALIAELKKIFPGMIIIKNDPTYIQGFPDLLCLYNDRWAALECKRSENGHKQPNQKYYIDKLNCMSFASFIFPENKEEVINALQRSLKSGRSARSSSSK